MINKVNRPNDFRSTYLEATLYNNLQTYSH